jgi:ATP-dependent DNA helicase UvrD/PcrA
VVSLLRRVVVNLLRRQVVSLNRREVVSLTVFSTELQKLLIVKYPNLIFDTKNPDEKTDIVEALAMLLKDVNSNLGWRILTEELQSGLELRGAVLKAQEDIPFKEVISKEFVDKVISVLDRIRSAQRESRDFMILEKASIVAILNEHAEEVITYFSPGEVQENIEPPPDTPTILLRTFEGSKGLSGGHVFIISANNGSLPKYENDGTINDIEICKFIVALTRTRRQCHIISNDWMNSPVDKKNKPVPKLTRTMFLDFIPTKFINNLGYKRAKDI